VCLIRSVAFFGRRGTARRSGARLKKNRNAIDGARRRRLRPSSIWRRVLFHRAQVRIDFWQGLFLQYMRRHTAKAEVHLALLYPWFDPRYQ
jgi:hypothetical protein